MASAPLELSPAQLQHEDEEDAAEKSVLGGGTVSLLRDSMLVTTEGIARSLPCIA